MTYNGPGLLRPHNVLTVEKLNLKPVFASQWLLRWCKLTQVSQRATLAIYAQLATPSQDLLPFAKDSACGHRCNRHGHLRLCVAQVVNGCRCTCTFACRSLQLKRGLMDFSLKWGDLGRFDPTITLLACALRGHMCVLAIVYEAIKESVAITLIKLCLLLRLEQISRSGGCFSFPTETDCIRWLLIR